MKKTVRFKRNKIVNAIVFSLLMLLVSIWFIRDPDIFIRNRWMKAMHIQIIGTIGIITFSLLVYSFVAISTRKVALIITNEYLIDYSRFESLGKIYWSEINSIEKVKKHSLKINIKDCQSKNKKNNFLKRLIFDIQNSTNRGSIVISSALLDCDREEIYETMSISHENSTQ